MMLSYFILGWSCLGALVLGSFTFRGKEWCTLEILNPRWLYNHCRVNVFGCGMLFLFLNLLCPVVSVGYWFYKLCTFGRK